MKTTKLLSAQDIADGYSVRPSRYSEGVYFARLWSPHSGMMGNTFFDGKRFTSREECQAAIDAAGGAGDARRCPLNAGYRENFYAGCA